MEWITDYWYILVVGLVVTMMLLGHRSGKGRNTNAGEQETEAQSGDKANKGGHSCCH